MSVASLMAIIFVCAVQIAAVRFLVETDQTLGWFALPGVTILSFCALLIVRQLVCSGKTTPFITGFEIAGAIGLCVALQFEPIYRRMYFSVDGYVDPLFGDPPLSNYPRLVLALLVSAFPNFLFALGGGWIARVVGLSLTLETSRREAGHSS
jgi:hypothetical protein